MLRKRAARETSPSMVDLTRLYYPSPDQRLPFSFALPIYGHLRTMSGNQAEVVAAKKSESTSSIELKKKYHANQHETSLLATLKVGF